MKIHWKRHAQRYLALTDANNSLYQPKMAQRYYEAHMEDIEFVLGWWKRTADEYMRRKVIKYWRRYLTNQKS